MTTKTEATNKRARVGFLLFGAALSLIPILGAIASNAAFASRLGKVQSGIAGSATHSDSNPEDPAPPPPVAIIEQAAVRMPQAQQRQADAIHRYWRDLDESLATSHDPREWVLESFLMLDHDGRPDDSNPPMAELKASGTLLRRAAETATDDRLVQWIWARAQPWASGCDKKRPCPDRAAALARLEPENAAAWEPVIVSAISSNDLQTAQAGLARMAAATHYDDRYVEAALAFRKLLGRHERPAAAVPVAENAEQRAVEPTTSDAARDQDAQSAAYVLTRGRPDGELISPASLCSRKRYPKAPGARFRDCERIGRLMLTTGTTLMARLEGRWYLSASGMGSREDRETARILAWQYWGTDDFPGSTEEPEFDMRISQWFSEVESTHDDVEAFRLSLRRRGIPLIPPRNWQPSDGPFGRTY